MRIKGWLDKYLEFWALAQYVLAKADGYLKSSTLNSR
jgi:hypothetical protein